jgi:hypothetical protein
MASVPPTKRAVAFRGVLGLRSARQTTHVRHGSSDVLGKPMEPGNNRQKTVINQEQINHRRFAVQGVAGAIGAVQL